MWEMCSLTLVDYLPAVGAATDPAFVAYVLLYASLSATSEERCK